MSATHVIRAPRASRQGILRLGCSAILLDSTGQQVLLTRRSDNGLWCLPGGRTEPGESVSETVVREFREETGLQVQIHRLTGVYSDPDQLIVYPDGNQVHMIVMTFLVHLVSGTLELTNETTAVQFFHIAQALQMDLFHDQATHLRDAISGNERPVIA